MANEMTNPDTFGAVPHEKLSSRVIGFVRRDAASHQARLETALNTEIEKIEGDPVQLSHVLPMLIQNAFDSFHDLPVERRVVTVETAAYTGV